MAKPTDDTTLIVFDRELHRVRGRAARLRRGIERGTAQWAKWSSTMDAAFALVDQIAGTPAHRPAGLAIKLGAVVWSLQETDAILDTKGLRQLRGLDREARKVAVTRGT